MEILHTIEVIDLTLESDHDTDSEPSQNEVIYANHSVKKEVEEPAGISKIPSMAQREVAQSIEEESASNLKFTPVALREIADADAIPRNVPATKNVEESGTSKTAPVISIPPRPIAPPQLSDDQLFARDQDLEDKLRQGISYFHASQASDGPVITPQGSDLSNAFSGPAHTLHHINDEGEDITAAAEFQKLKKNHECRMQTTLSEEIKYCTALQAEKKRLRLQRRQSAFAEREAQDAADDERLFFSDIERSPVNEPSNFPISSLDEDSDAPVPKRTKSNRANKIPPSAFQESMHLGFDASNRRIRKSAKKEHKPKQPSKKKVSTDKVTKSKSKTDAHKTPKKRGRPRKGPEISNFASLLDNDLIANAQANRTKPDVPAFTSTVRRNALAELIASMPADQQKLHSADRTALDKACRAFDRSIRAKGKDGWMLRGLRSCLMNHQLLGAAFMRDREHSSTHPYGGIQSDDMGLGKTVMMIANMIDGKATNNSPNRTTLIVCPPALTTQWMNEIGKHSEAGALGEVLVYRSGARLMSSDPARTLSNMGVVITTYQEVLRSYPRSDRPMHLVSEEAKQLWWREHYEKTRGVLHRIFFRRIVLDEAQCIKNHMSKTSVAVRGLLGKYRWAISGTPIQNSLEEFYPYFAFLKVEHTGDFETFKRNFCKKGSAIAKDRLQVYLQKIMVRRTHKDELFGAPILKLPEVNQETIQVEFNEVERSIYRVVESRFISNIRGYSSAGVIDKKYQFVFTLLLRLRQLAGHILLIQKTLKEILETEDLERLWKLTDNESTTDKESGKLLMTLKGGLAMVQKPSLSSTTSGNEGQSNAPPYQSTTVPTEFDEPADSAVESGPAFKFRRYLKSLHDDGQWGAINMRSCCHACGQAPQQPYITSCMHVYCKVCLEDISFAAAQEENTKTKCNECGTEYDKTEACRGFEEAGHEDGSPSSARSTNRKKKKKSSDEEDDIDWFTVGGPVLRSAKTKAAEAQIEAWLAQDPDAKIIVFTQFIGIIKIMSRICTEREWGHSLFHGGMSFDSRDAAIISFSNEPDTKILLASLKAGGIGLNLTAANRVIIIDLWFNESVETQAFCRVFRIGQTRDVELRRFVVKDSVDTYILRMQERKNAEIATSHERRSTKLTTDELVRLFGPLARDGAGEITAEGEDEPFIFVQDPFEQNDSDSDVEEIPRTVPPRPF